MVPIGTRKSQQKFQEITIVEDNIDFYSFLSSFIFHVIVIIGMALIYGGEQTQHAPIVISFANIDDNLTEEPLAVELPEVDLEELSSTNSTNQHVAIQLPEDTSINSLSVLDNLIDNTLVKPGIETLSPADLISTAIELSDTPEEITDHAPATSKDAEEILSDLIGSISAGIATNNSAQQAALSVSGNDIGTRLKKAGAKTGDITISIAWNTIDDIDLHVHYTPGNGLVDNINWTNRIGRLSGGMLDVDMNANYGEIVRFPVENVFWPIRSSPQGSFAVYIHFYRSWSGNHRVPVTVILKRIGHKDESFNITAILGSSPQRVTSFNNLPDKRKF